MKNIYLIILAFLSSIICFAQAGTLDSSFSNVGFFRANEKYFSIGTIQPDNKFVLAGSGFPYRYRDVMIYRYTKEGLPDASFGTGGTSSATVGGNSAPRSILIQQDGKILVAAESRFVNTSGDVVTAVISIVRLHANGAIDETFGEHGFAKITYGNAGSVYAGEFSMALQQDGKILLSGPDYTITDSTFSLWRFNINGSADSSFGENGRVIKTLTAHAFSTRIVVQTDGKIVYCGETTGYDRFVARYLPSGMPDTSFNGTGFYLHRGQGRYVDAVIQTDGKILAAIDLGNIFYLQRINANGTPDVTFGFNGLIQTKFSLPVYTSSVDLQTNGKIIVGGSFAPIPGAYGYGMAFARYHPSGNLDSTFGSSGVVMKYFGYTTGGIVIGLTKERIYIIGSGSETVGNYLNYGVVAAFKIAEPPPPCENDTVRPVVTCTTDLILSSTSSKIYPIPVLETTDNCGVKSVSFSITGATSRSGSGNNATGAFNTGMSFINWRVTDSSNNFTTCKSSVTIRPPSSSVTVTVPGTANPWLAGMPDGTQSLYGDMAPSNAPVPENINLSAGSWIEISNALGVVSHGFYPLVGPEGCQNAIECQFESFIISHDVGAEHGKSDLRAPINSLVGVFLDNSTPTEPAPSPLDFSTASSRDYTELRPQLKQIFFIGDGKTSSGAQQKIFIPEHASRLFLGTMDGVEWNNNNGAFNVTISMLGNPISESCGKNKVRICHKGKTICIASSAVAAHLAHGDKSGSCFISSPGKSKGKKGDASVLDKEMLASLKVYNAPNPFKSNTRVQYELPGNGHVLIKVYNAMGREMATLVNSKHQAGIYSADFSTGTLSAGVYYYRLTYTTEQQNLLFIKSGKMVIVK